MQKILFKRVRRNLLQNLPRYLILLFLIVVSLFIVLSYATSGKTVVEGSKAVSIEDKVEDGEFVTLYPLSEDELTEAEQIGSIIEESFNMDFTVFDKATIRVFKNRKDINLVRLSDGGKLPSKENEIVIEKRFSEENNLKIGQRLNIGGVDFTITGIGTSVDYEGPFKTLGDSAINSALFGTAFVNEEGYELLKEKGNNTGAENYLYSYRLKNGGTNKALKEKIKEFNIPYTDVGTLAQFIEKKNNPRIASSVSDAEININTSLFLGVIVLILFSYIIAVFVTHEIEKDNSVIGTLYALGVTRKDLILHYLELSFIITFLGGIIGFFLGTSNFACNLMMIEQKSYFSLPELTIVKSPFYAIYAIVLPPLIAIIVNLIVISKKLNRPALSLIRNESKASKVREVHIKNIKDTKKNFISRFRFRQLIREIRSALTVVCGIFISYIILIMGINCFVFCTTIKNKAKEDITFKNMYTYKYLQSEDVENGEECYAKTFIKNINGFDFNITLLGIREDNEFFNLKYTNEDDSVSISDSVATKYNIKVGDDISLIDENEDKEYIFKVREIIKYSPSFMVYMDIDKARSLFDIEEGMYNVVLSNKDLDIDQNLLYNTETDKDILESSEIFLSLMKPLIFTLLFVSSLLFIFVMYLMMKVMIDRSSNNIALFGVFGYKAKEIKSLYLDGNFFLVAVGSFIALPLAKIIMDICYPLFLIANVGSGVYISYPPVYYPIIYIATLLLYLIINNLLMIRINKINPSIILKNRE